MKEILQIRNFVDDFTPAVQAANAFLKEMNAADIELISKYPGFGYGSANYNTGGILIVYRERIPDPADKVVSPGD